MDIDGISREGLKVALWVAATLAFGARISREGLKVTCCMYDWSASLSMAGISREGLKAIINSVGRVWRRDVESQEKD